MHRKAIPFFIKVITPLHAGSGQDLGIVDLPIQRERHTGFPKIEASGLKGSIREIFEENNSIDKKIISILFGPEDADNAYAGALGFTDARILLFPVKSAKGVFAWITCPRVLEKFKREMELAGENVDFDVSNVEDGKCLVTEDSALVINNAVILEEYAFKVFDEKIDDRLAKKLSNFTKIDSSKLLILSDNDFTDFVNLSTEVITRTRIDNETGTVKSGALFTEEYLPSETVMYSLALATAIFSKDKGIFNKQDKSEAEQILEFWSKKMPDVMQIGGNATIGKGIVEILVVKESQDENNK